MLNTFMLLPPRPSRNHNLNCWRLSGCIAEGPGLPAGSCVSPVWPSNLLPTSAADTYFAFKAGSSFSTFFAGAD